MKHAVLRNFGGLDSIQPPVEVFEEKLARDINVNSQVHVLDNNTVS